MDGEIMSKILCMSWLAIQSSLKFTIVLCFFFWSSEINHSSTLEDMRHWDKCYISFLHISHTCSMYSDCFGITKCADFNKIIQTVVSSSDPSYVFISALQVLIDCSIGMYSYILIILVSLICYHWFISFFN